MKKKVFYFASSIALMSYSLFAYSEGPHWGYVGEHGPKEWGNLEPATKPCSVGKRQSPIDINSSNIKENKSLPNLMFSYVSAPLKILNNGHTIQMNYPKGSKITIGGNSYDLLKFHFHTPSEHAIKGKRTELEVHFVNKNADGLAVVGVLLKKGKKNSALAGMFSNLPNKQGEVTVDKETMNPIELIPKDKDYYTYPGSLTTPPCSEIVTWYVVKDQIEVSEDQIKNFKKIFAMNARSLQSLSQRIVEEKD
ncbi:MAG: carbonic anhydrase family protein [Silvanigrellaceae bacterium]|nr:carbonic anhydrase family protein [Silvanigrellaceae bacterium]